MWPTLAHFRACLLGTWELPVHRVCGRCPRSQKPRGSFLQEGQERRVCSALLPDCPSPRSGKGEPQLSVRGQGAAPGKGGRVGLPAGSVVLCGSTGQRTTLILYGPCSVPSRSQTSFSFIIIILKIFFVVVKSI